jgi:hypothetical protein
MEEISPHGVEWRTLMNTSPARILIRPYGDKKTARKFLYKYFYHHPCPKSDEFRYICLADQLSFLSELVGVRAWR